MTYDWTGSNPAVQPHGAIAPASCPHHRAVAQEGKHISLVIDQLHNLLMRIFATPLEYVV